MEETCLVQSNKPPPLPPENQSNELKSKLYVQRVPEEKGTEISQTRRPESLMEIFPPRQLNSEGGWGRWEENP
jgi:hypothetical protein